ncbi:MAG: SDR family oxidoreductase [Candidatus Promineofilum sp.]|nr:SDR family oxidoreductase [Promineifilum sp.]
MSNSKTTSHWGRKVALAGLAAAGAFVAARRVGAAARANAPRPIPLPRGRAVITGASAGIGEEFARQLAAAGFDLTLVARREDRLRTLADELSAAHGIRAEAWPADLADEADVAALAGALATADDLALLVNNAGFGTRGEFIEVELERTLDMIRVHVLATVTLCRAAAPGMIARGGGAIINVSSIAAFFPSAGGANYGATKAYLNAFSEALAAELRGTGVAVQALCPGFTTTEFHDVGDYQNFDRGQIPAPLWMPARDVVAESLAALGSGRVIVVPGAKYRAIVAAANSPLGNPIRQAARAVRARWRKG